MIRLTFLIFILFFLSNCSFNEKSRLWKDKEKKIASNNNIQKILSEEKKITSEFNEKLKLDLSTIKSNNKIFENKNNYGFQSYNGSINKIGNYKFSKFDNINQLDYKPLFLDDGLIFFDDKGSIIKYDKNQKVLWKKNHYTKSEKKLKPRLSFALDGENLLIIDNIAKYYSVNINTGKLNWLKNNTYPFNSEIKKIEKKFFAVDYKNTLRCYNISDGSECWSLQTENSFLISNSKYSLIIIGEMVIFSNSIGDITAVDINSGLINWQLPTQSSNIIQESYNFKISKLVSDDKTIFFSNNKQEFFSVDVKTGTVNWINKISSNLTPVIGGNLLFTVSDDGYLHVIEKNAGNIIRITDLYRNYKIKKRKKIKPVGFAIGDTKLYLLNTDGKMIIVDLSIGNLLEVKKIAGNFTSKPFIFNKNLFVIRNGSIIQYQ